MKIIEEIFSNKDNIRKVIKCKRKEEIEDIFVGREIELTDDLFNNIKKFFDKLMEECKKISKADLNKIICKCKEMGEDDLDNVVGGISEGAAGGAVLGGTLASPFALLVGGFAGATLVNCGYKNLTVNAATLGISGGGVALGALCGAAIGSLLECCSEAIS